MIAIMNITLELFVEKKKPYFVPPDLMVGQEEGYIVLIPRQLSLDI